MNRTPLAGEEFHVYPRLIDAGESLVLQTHGAEPGDRLEVFPRYLESAPRKRAKGAADDPLSWLDGNAAESLPVGRPVDYRPTAAGNYLARWTSRRHGTLYRYFAAIDPTYVVYRPAIWDWPTPFPLRDAVEVHQAGLPFDWCMDAEKIGGQRLSRLREEQRRYGGCVVPGMPAAEGESREEATAALRTVFAQLRRAGVEAGRIANLWYGSRLSNERVQTAREAGVSVIDGYVPRASYCGLGAPYYPFYIGAVDYRMPSQQGPTDAMACIYDFVGSWHFHGPVGFHRPSARGSWERARYYLDLAAREAALTASNSKVHNFLTTLINFESPVAWGEQTYQIEWDDERGREFMQQYLDLLAFDHPQRWPIVFSRAVDYADYFRAHHQHMPRRLVSSVSHDLGYDRYWTDEWHEHRLESPGYVPVHQQLGLFRAARTMPQYNMPMSREFVNYNDNQRTCRFEYACPKPVHYYELTGSHPWPTQPVETDVPDPEIRTVTHSSPQQHEVVINLSGGRVFRDYLLLLWDIPRTCRQWHLDTDAKEVVWVDNTDGDGRVLVRFDLADETVVSLIWRCPVPAAAGTVA